MNNETLTLIENKFCRDSLACADPYDIWKTTAGIKTRKIFYKNKFLGIIPAGIMTIYDYYLNNDYRVGYSQQEYPIVRALAALALLNLYEQQENKNNYLDYAKKHIDWLTNNYSKGYAGYCWGLGFDWVYSSEKTYAMDTPFSTHTPYPLEALIKYYQLTEDDSVLSIIQSVYSFLNTDLKIMLETPEYLAYSYSTEKDRIITNANSYIMYMYALLVDFLPDKKAEIKDKITKIYSFITSHQKDNGAWLYTPNDESSFIDCFHSAFIIKNIYKTNNIIPLDNAMFYIQKGYDYLLDDFLIKDTSLFKRFSKENKISIVKYDLYDNAEMLNLALMLNDHKTVGNLSLAIKKTFFDKDNTIGSTIDLFGNIKNKNQLRWAVAPYLYSLSTERF